MAIFATSGDNPWFWSKKANFSNILFFRQYKPGKCLLRYQFLNEKTPFEAIKTRLSKKAIKTKSQKCREINPWIWSENGHFSKIFFLANIGQENAFYHILQRKSNFLGYKNKKFKKSKN